MLARSGWVGRVAVLWLGMLMAVAPVGNSQPDLSIEPAGIHVEPAFECPGEPKQTYPILVEKGQPLRFTATIANQGDEAVRRTYAEIDINRYPVESGEEPVWVGVIAPLDVRANDDVTRAFTPGRGQRPAFVPEQCGIYNAVVNVDPERTVREDRGNNLAGVPLQVVERDPEHEGEGPPIVLPDLICEEFEQLIVGTADEPDVHHKQIKVGDELRFLVAVRLEGAGPFPSYVEVEVNPQGADEDAEPLWHGVFAFDDLQAGRAVSGVARARAEDRLPVLWKPTAPGTYIIGAVADPGYYSEELDCFLPRGGLIEPEGKDCDFREEVKDDPLKRYGNNAVFRTITVRP